MIDRLLDKPNKKSSTNGPDNPDKPARVGDEDPIMNSLQTRLKLEGIDLGMKGISMVNIDGVDQSVIMKPHNPNSINNELIDTNEGDDS